MTTELEGHDSIGSSMDRRSLLRLGLAGAAVIGGSSLLSGCSDGASSGEGAAPPARLPTTSGAGTPSGGGTLTVGGLSGGASETLNPLRSTSNTDAIRSFQLYDRLFHPSENLKDLVPQLAESAESNADASVWTIRLRSGVVWHDGKPLTANDVVYSIRFWADPMGNASGQVANIDMKNVRAIDELTVEVPLLAPQANWIATPTTRLNFIIPDGTKAETLNTAPIGTGPFKFESFTPGRESVFVANTDYWQEGKPHLDKLIFNTSFTDETARLNGLLSGQIDVLPQVPFPTAKAQMAESSGITVFGSPSPAPYMFIMRVDEGPMADPQIRQAIRLVADRQKLIDGALSGFGTVGHDLLGIGTKYYADDLQRERDVDEARALIKSAGAEGTTFTLATSDVGPGYTESATLLAAQAKEAGINIKVDRISPSTYYTPAGGFLGGPFRQDNYLALSTLSGYYTSYMSKAASLNETFWGHQPGGAQAEKLLAQAVKETDEASAEELWHEVQQLQFDSGGLLLWAQPDFVNLAAARAKGVTEGPTGFLNNGSLYNAWVSDS